MAAETKKAFLFVYGTLRRRQKNEVSRLLRKHAHFVGRGDLRGRLFLVKGFPGADFPGAVDSSSSEDRVRGEVYELNDGQALLEKLDEYEECGPNDPKPTLYRRE